MFRNPYLIENIMFRNTLLDDNFKKHYPHDLNALKHFLLDELLLI